MIGSFWIVEFDLWVTFFIALFVVHSFYVIKDGKLRVLMIQYFSVVAFTYGGAAIFYLSQKYHWFYIEPTVFRLIITMPKTIVMLMLFDYLRSTKK